MNFCKHLLYLSSLVYLCYLGLAVYGATCGPADGDSSLIFANVTNLANINDILTVSTEAPGITAISDMDNNTLLVIFDNCNHYYKVDPAYGRLTYLYQGKSSSYKSVDTEYTYCGNPLNCKTYLPNKDTSLLLDAKAKIVNTDSFEFGYTSCGYQIAAINGTIFHTGILSTNEKLESDSLSIDMDVSSRVPLKLYGLYDNELANYKLFERRTSLRNYVGKFYDERTTADDVRCTLTDEPESDEDFVKIPINHDIIPILLTISNKNNEIKSVSQLTKVIDKSTIGCDDKCNLVTSIDIPQNLPVSIKCSNQVLKSRVFNSRLSLSLSQFASTCLRTLPISCKGCGASGSNSRARKLWSESQREVKSVTLPIVGVSTKGAPVVVPTESSGESYGITAGISIAIFVSMMTCFCFLVSIIFICYNCYNNEAKDPADNLSSSKSIDKSKSSL